MAMLNIGVLLIVSSLLIAMPNGNYARKQEGPATEKAWFQNIRQGNEIVAKLHFYVQAFLVGKHATVYEVARSSITSSSPTSFGLVYVLDDPVTVEPDSNSKELGRLQGLITSADLVIPANAVNLNFYFTVGKYNRSTISIVGRNQIVDKERELVVVGGTGIFRFARGYAITKTHSFDVATSHGILEYTIYVSYAKGSSINLEANI